MYYFPTTILSVECFATHIEHEMYGCDFPEACTHGDEEAIIAIHTTFPLSADVRMDGFLRAVKNGHGHVLSYLWNMLTEEQQQEYLCQAIDKHLPVVEQLLPLLSAEQRHLGYYHMIDIQDFNTLDIMWPWISTTQVPDPVPVLAPMVALMPAPMPAIIPAIMPAQVQVAVPSQELVDASAGLVAFSMEVGAAAILFTLSQ